MDGLRDGVGVNDHNIGGLVAELHLPQSISLPRAWNVRGACGGPGFSDGRIS